MAQSAGEFWNTYCQAVDSNRSSE